MSRKVFRLLGAVLALVFTGSQAAAGERPLAVSDIVATGAFGRASMSPDGRWALYEKRGAYDTAPRYDLGPRSTWAITDLWLVDLQRRGAPPERLLAGEGPGLIRGPWSPNGGRLVVYRLRGLDLEIGIVTLSDRSVRWTGLTPEMPTTGSAVEWTCDDQLVLMTRPDGSPPGLLRYYAGPGPAALAAWQHTANGDQPSRTMVDTDAGVFSTEAPADEQALIVLDAGSGRSRVLARGRLRDFALSSDGTGMALLQAGEAVPIGADAIIQMEVPNRQRLTLVDLQSGAVAELDAGLDVAPHLLRWSPDGREVLVWARADGRAWSEGDLFRVRRDGSSARLDQGDLLSRPAGSGIDTLRGVQADWLGDAPILYAQDPDGNRSDWYLLSEGAPPRPLTAALSVAPARLAAVSGDTALAFADQGLWAIEPGGARRLTSQAPGVREAVIGDIEKPFRLRMNDAPRQGWVSGLDEAGRAVSLDASGALRRLDIDGPAAGRVLAASQARALVVRASGMVETLRLVTRQGGRDLDMVNQGLADVVLPAPALLAHRDVFGRDTQSALFMPAGRSPSQVRGIIVQVYPGYVDTGVWTGPFTLTYGLRAAVLAGAGYAVLSPSIPVDRPGPNPADGYLASVEVAVDAALKAWPDLPADRIAIVGHSWGGLLALTIATRSSRYRSYISWAGATGMISQWGEFVPGTRILPQGGPMMRNQQGWLETGQGGIAGPPWVDTAGYLQNSPLLAADRITAPVMMITADRDFVPMSQAELMFSARYRLGGRARLVTYWGEDHSLWSPANIEDLYRQVFSWLDETLSEVPASVAASTAVAPRPEASPRTLLRP